LHYHQNWKYSSIYLVSQWVKNVWRQSTFEKRLEAFHTVATTGGFTRAAEVLNGLDLTQRFIEIINYILDGL